MTYELDHAGFIIRDSKGLHIVVYGIQRGLGMEVFPVDLIYRPWKHAEGQVIKSQEFISSCKLIKNTQVYVVFFFPKMKCVCVSNAQSELSDSVSVSSCHSFSIR